MRLWGLLWTLLVSGLQAATESYEEKVVLKEGETLTVDCPANRKYAYNLKAWQRLTDGGEPQTLAVTEETSGTFSQIQVGRCILQDDPAESMLHVQMINLQAEDSGLYRCVIYYPPPKSPVPLFHPVRLVVTTNSSVDKKSTSTSTQIPTLPTTSIYHTSHRTVAQTLSTRTAIISPDTGVNLTKVANVIRVPVFGIVVPVACGILIKSLVFTVLFAVTQRSFGR